MAIPKWANTVTPLTKIIAFILFISLPFVGFAAGWTIKDLMVTADKQISDTYNNGNTELLNQILTKQKQQSAHPVQYITVRGILKKEAIPEDLQLGDYWHWLYFDEPFLLEENAMGFPKYVNSLEVVSSSVNKINLDDYVNKHIEATATLTWGYAESRMLEIVAITEL